jgi:hypothetical protein
MATIYYTPSKDSEILQDIINHLESRGPAEGRETVTPAVIARWERKLKKLKKSLRLALKREEEQLAAGTADYQELIAA